MRALGALLGLLLVGLAAPVAADAARVEVQSTTQEEGGYRDEYDAVVKILRIGAGKRERNRITVRQGKQGRWVVIDRGRRPTPGNRCKRRGRNAVVCTLGKHDLRELSVSLGDRSDRLQVRGQLLMAVTVSAGAGHDLVRSGYDSATVRGGAGRDRLVGSPQADELDGGPGDDRLLGKGGGDELRDGPGRDRVSGGRGIDGVFTNDGRRPVADRFDGGPGRDRISYATRKRGVTATLGATGGVRGERDRLRHFERLTGTRKADVLTGGDGKDRIEGLRGADRIDGRAGRDVLQGGHGATATCGAGFDVVIAARSGGTLLEPDCEEARNANAEDGVLAQPAGVAPEALAVRQRCRSTYPSHQTLAELRTPAAGLPWAVGQSGALLADGVAEGPSGLGCTVGLALTDLGRAVLVPGSQVVVAVLDGEPRWSVRFTVPAG